MRKNMIVTTEIVLLAGFIGAFLRLWEVLTIFDPVTGLAKKHALPSVLLIVLTLTVMLMIVWYGFSLVKQKHINVDLNTPFPIRNKISMMVLTVMGAIIALGSVLNYVLDTAETIVFRGIFALLGIGAGVAIIACAAAYKSGEKKLRALTCIPAMFMCFWLVMTYKENNTNPVILEYCYKCVAIAATTLSFYYAAGHYYDRLTPKRTIITHLLGVYFCLVTTLNAGNIAQSAIFIALAIYQLVSCCAYISGETKKENAE